MCPYCTLLCAHSPNHRIWVGGGSLAITLMADAGSAPCYALLLQEDFEDDQCQGWGLRSVTPGVLLGSLAGRQHHQKLLVTATHLGMENTPQGRIELPPVLVPPQWPGLSNLQWVSIVMITTMEITSHWSFFGGPLRLRISCAMILANFPYHVLLHEQVCL